MKNLAALFIILLITVTNSYAQSETCDCKKDLDFIVEKIVKMPSYKKQIVNEKLVEFNSVYNNLVSKMQQPLILVECFKLLQQQLMVVNDIHANIYFNKNFFNEQDLDNETKLTELKNSSVFKNHPKTFANVTELKTILAQKPENSLEGIYDFKDVQKIGIYQSEDNKHLIGVVLESSINNWEVGEIRFYATPTIGNKYDLFEYNIITRSPSVFKSMSFQNGRLRNYKKTTNTLNYELASKENSNLEFKELANDVQYIYFSNFNSFSTKNRKAFKVFYEKVKNNLTAKNVIVDLRSNGGGNKKLSDPFLKLLKGKNIYIITNSFSASNAEQFTVKLRKIKNAIHLGQSTMGAIAYGMNHGYTYPTPSEFFIIKPTDMDFHKYVEYEGKGVIPNVSLSFDRNWIDQTLEIIEKTNK